MNNTTNNLLPIIIEDKKENQNAWNKDSKETLFMYGIGGLMGFTVLNQIVKRLEWKIIFCVIITLITVYLINDYRLKNNMVRMKVIDMKLSEIEPSPSYFYLDSGIIELVHSISIDYKIYNPDVYKKLVLSLDMFLEMVHRINVYPDIGYALIDNMIDYKKQALNHLHSMIYTIPNTPHELERLKKLRNTLHLILNNHIDEFRKSLNKNHDENISMYTKQISSEYDQEGIHDDPMSIHYDMY